jgi:hypothetical protein
MKIIFLLIIIVSILIIYNIFFEKNNKIEYLTNNNIQYLTNNNKIQYLENNDKIQYWENIKFNFNMDDFKNKCGNEIVNLGDYSDNEKPNLHYSKKTKIKFIEWFDESRKVIGLGNKQTKILFFKETQNPITLYMLNWLYSIKSNLPIKLQERLNYNNTFSLRISRGKWECPSHFDAVDNYMIVISGNRHVIFDNKIKMKIKPNDILFFSSGIYHHFWCDSLNDLNIVLSISYEYDNDNVKKEFANQYPKQVKRLINYDDFIDYNL